MPIVSARRAELGLMTEEELAEVLEVKVSTLQDWRQQETGPYYAKLGKGIYYRHADVKEWVELNVVATNRTAAPRQAPQKSRRPLVEVALAAMVTVCTLSGSWVYGHCTADLKDIIDRYDVIDGA